MKKQLLSILLCLIMVVGLLPTAALAEEAAPAFNLATALAGIEIPDDLVTCICTTTNESKKYGQLPAAFLLLRRLRRRMVSGRLLSLSRNPSISLNLEKTRVANMNQIQNTLPTSLTRFSSS